MVLSQTEENYLKAIFKLSEKNEGFIQTNAIAEQMQTSAASVTDMIKKLSEKGFIEYKRYKGSMLSTSGDTIARNLVRKHRLWEVFLVQKLNFKWDEVHAIAEQLEHIQSDKLTECLDEFLSFPKFDPHGDPIPDAKGNIAYISDCNLSEAPLNVDHIVVGVKDHDSAFLHYLDKTEIGLGTKIKVKENHQFDNSLTIVIDNKKEINVSQQIGMYLFVKSV